jgi:rhodanese-related sulfurtransferase
MRFVPITQKKPLKIFDVREPVEFEDKIPNAVYTGRGLLESKIEQYAEVNDTVVLYCAGGFRSLLAADTLQKMGYKNVYSLQGTFG